MSAPARRDRAACLSTDPDLFFPVSHPQSGAYAAEAPRAKAVCASCPVTGDRLRYAAAAREPEGIWAGTTPADRQRLRRHLAGSAA